VPLLFGRAHHFPVIDIVSTAILAPFDMAAGQNVALALDAKHDWKQVMRVVEKAQRSSAMALREQGVDARAGEPSQLGKRGPDGGLTA